mgnify:CR=1 FL=1
MKVNFVWLRAFTISILTVFSILVWLPVADSAESATDLLEVRFMDVGQGDAIYVRTPDGVEVVIDGGASTAVLLELAKDRSLFDRSLDVVIATHPDTDHVGGLNDVLERYQVGTILWTEVDHEAAAARAFARAAAAEGAKLISAQAGQVIQLGASTTMRVLSPFGDTSNWESNAASIIVQLTYGDIDFMLTGDAPMGIEDYLSKTHGASLASEVLKLGHHGSKTSTSDLFLSVVQPDYAVVSAGRDNRYGHPNTEVVERTLNAGAKILNTAEEGTIIFKTDGKAVWVK